MKSKFLHVLPFLLLFLSVRAQTLYGTTFNGGDDGGGTINKFIPATNNFTLAKSFADLAAHPYYTNLTEATDGKLYGMTSQGGSRGYGVIFSFDPSSSTYRKLKDFDSNDGGTNPFGSLIQATDGKLYGMTTFGGSSGFYGVIFSFDASTLSYTKLKDFNEEDGGNPYGSLIQAADGKLYGMTSNGGGNAAGVIFSFDPATSDYKKLKDFNNTDGRYPNGSLTEAGDGKLYGMTSGASDGGYVIFSFDPSSSEYEKLKEFNGDDGDNPNGNLLQATDGKLYGLTTGGGDDGYGFIFSYDPKSSVYSTLKAFNKATGRNPYGSLMQATNGRLYGLTAFGGSDDIGVIFSFDPSSSTYTDVKNFERSNGANPYGSVLQSKNGKLYGMTLNGGTSGAGVIFSFDPSTANYTKLKDFDDTQPAYPRGSLVRASNGMLYGTTTSGGSNRGGVIFSFDPSTSVVKTVKNFEGSDGSTPYGTPIQARDGKLYGMTIDGGSSDYGVIFSYDPSTSEFKKLKDFDRTNGAYPIGSLIQATDGKLYGMTSQGGSSGAGVIFSLDPLNLSYTILKNLDDTNGSYPYGSLVQTTEGKLYGMTSKGGNNDVGVIFSFDPTSSTYQKLSDFDEASGARPFGSLMVDSSGKLYGMTPGGGLNRFGVIFSFDPFSSTYKKLHDFDSVNGANPYGNLMEASDGKLYGMTSKGGSNDYGVAFSYDPSSLSYTTINSFNYFNGAQPSFGSAFIEVSDNQGTPPSITLTTPENNAVYLAPAAHIKLSATASDANGSISKVEFYNGTHLLHTEHVVPYGFVWRNLALGNYTLTAKAYDNSGLVTTSAPVHISVVRNIPPVVGIIKPKNNQAFAAPGYIPMEADAKDVDGRITRVEFYNGSTLLNTQYQPPYTFVWKDLPAGTYTIIAIATDNWGAHTASAPVAFEVIQPDIKIVNNKPSSPSVEMNIKKEVGLKVTPNPTTGILTIYSIGFQQGKQQSISVISASGIVMKTMQLNAKTIQLDVSSLVNGLYTVRMISGDKVLYKKFIKL